MGPARHGARVQANLCKIVLVGGWVGGWGGYVCACVCVWRGEGGAEGERACESAGGCTLSLSAPPPPWWQGDYNHYNPSPGPLQWSRTCPALPPPPDAKTHLPPPPPPRCQCSPGLPLRSPVRPPPRCQTRSWHCHWHCDA